MRVLQPTSSVAFLWSRLRRTQLVMHSLLESAGVLNHLLRCDTHVRAANFASSSSSCAPFFSKNGVDAAPWKPPSRTQRWVNTNRVRIPDTSFALMDAVSLVANTAAGAASSWLACSIGDLCDCVFPGHGSSSLPACSHLSDLPGSFLVSGLSHWRCHPQCSARDRRPSAGLRC